MCAIRPSLLVRDADAAYTRDTEPARPTPSRPLEDLLDALQFSFVLDGIDEYLERVLGWGVPPLSPAESKKIVPQLHGSLWWLVTEVLRRTNGRPDGALKDLVGLAGRLGGEAAADGSTPDPVHARRVALLVSTLLDEVADDDDGPLPYFGVEQDTRWSA